MEPMQDTSNVWMLADGNDTVPNGSIILPRFVGNDKTAEKRQRILMSIDLGSDGLDLNTCVMGLG